MITISGAVIGGKKIGGKLGFPTINIQYPSGVAPRDEGIYCSLVWIGGKVYPGITHLGIIKTFTPHRRTCETYLLTMNGDLYGKQVTKKLMYKVRPVERFSTAAALVRQIKKDITIAKNFFGL